MGASPHTPSPLGWGQHHPYARKLHKIGGEGGGGEGGAVIRQ